MSVVPFLTSRSTVPFLKMHGLRNDFIFIDASNHDLFRDVDAFFTRQRISRMSDRRSGVGCDQFVVLGATHYHHVVEEEGIRAVVHVPVRIYNGLEGTEVGMCGNALRCIALLVAKKHVQLQVTEKSSSRSSDNGINFPQVDIELTYFSKPGRCPMVKSCTIREYSEKNPLRGIVAVNMGVPTFTLNSLPATIPEEYFKRYDPENFVALLDISVVADFFSREWPQELRHAWLLRCCCCSLDGVFKKEEDGGQLVEAALISFGNPHLVLLFTPPCNVEKEDPLMCTGLVHALGERLEKFPWFPERINVEFIILPHHGHKDVEKKNDVRMKVWERGAGISEACGSGACAAGVVVAKYSGTSVQCVVMDGGALQIETNLDTCNVVMVGEGTFVFEGEVLV